MSRLLRCAFALAAAGCSALAAAPAAALAAKPATFRVGAATASLDPPMPVYAGGFGASPPITKVDDPLSVRAVYISNGRRAVVLATVDSQGYFAAYQQGPGFGISADRRDAAAAVSALGGPKLAPGDIVEQATHSHAAPTVEGIWGPVPTAYLKLVHDRTVAAIVQAAKAAQPAHLQWGSVEAPYLDNVNTAQTDSYAGWTQDGQLSVLRALDYDDDATIATFANVSVHPDIVVGAKLKTLSADYFGFARSALEDRLGGVAIVGPATLGREESPIQATTLDNSRWFAGTVGELVTRALEHPHWVTDPTIQSTEQMLYIPGTNAALLALVAAWNLPDPQKQQEMDASGIYPIPRSTQPPWQTGSLIGTPLTALRIGRLAYVSQPGEPFPEVRHAIAEATRGADLVIALSKGQDDLGYYYPTFVYPFAFVYNSDHHIYNVAPQAGDQIVEGQIANLAALGFDSRFNVARPLPTNYQQDFQPGLQALASPARGDAGPGGVFTTTLQAIDDQAAFGGAPMTGKVHWDFGDGSSADTPAASFDPGAPKEARFTHAFRPGRYTVKLRAHDTQGRQATWQLEVVAYPRLTARIRVRRVRRRAATYDFVAQSTGGNGALLAWRWRFGDGTTALEPRVRHSFRRGVRPRATLTIVDATGASASASYRAPRARQRRAR